MRKRTQLGLEPTTPEVEVECANQRATPSQTELQHLKSTILHSLQKLSRESITAPGIVCPLCNRDATEFLVDLMERSHIQ